MKMYYVLYEPKNNDESGWVCLYCGNVDFETFGHFFSNICFVCAPTISIAPLTRKEKAKLARKVARYRKKYNIQKPPAVSKSLEDMIQYWKDYGCI